MHDKLSGTKGVLVLVAMFLMFLNQGMASAAEVVLSEGTTAGSYPVVELVENGAVISRMYFGPEEAWFDNVPVRFGCTVGEGLISIDGSTYLTSEMSEPNEALLASWESLTNEQAELLQKWSEALAVTPEILTCESGVYGASPACNQATLDAILAVGVAAAACAEGGPWSCTAASLAALRAIQREWEICGQG